MLILSILNSFSSFLILFSWPDKSLSTKIKIKWRQRYLNQIYRRDLGLCGRVCQFNCHALPSCFLKAKCDGQNPWVACYHHAGSDSDSGQYRGSQLPWMGPHSAFPYQSQVVFGAAGLSLSAWHSSTRLIFSKHQSWMRNCTEFPGQKEILA